MKLIITKNQVKPHGSLQIDDAMEMLMSATLTIMEQAVQSVPEEHQRSVREKIYDNYNEAASRLLMTFIPDKDMRPDMTEEAILRMQDEIMKEAIAGKFKRHERS